jgi:hypothetical protein
VRKRALGLLGVSAISVVLAAVGAAAAPAASTTFFLDSYNATDASVAFCSGASMLVPTTPPGCGNSIIAPLVFASGVTYKVKVAGAVSAWGAWPAHPCGKPEPASQFPSTGRPNMPAGDDAQFRFADPLSGACPSLPKKTSYFQVNLGSGWVHPIAKNDPSKPSGTRASSGAQHPYTFTFTGEGTAPQFRFVDFHASDNSGQFKITVVHP